MKYVKFDMHCHTKEGSSDSKIPIREYISELKRLGFGGMMVTDHDSYLGYESLRSEDTEGFTVIESIEYDTSDFGHFLVIMPDGMIPGDLRFRGMSLEKLEMLVHENGGILGPAHPGGEPFLSFYTTGITKSKHQRKKYLMELMDFIEGFNSCEDCHSNSRALYLGRKYNKTMIAGSDSHKKDSLGLGFTYLPEDISTNNDLIRYIRKKPNLRIGGKIWGKTLKDKLGIWNKGLVYGFFFYNKFETAVSMINKVFLCPEEKE